MTSWRVALALLAGLALLSSSAVKAAEPEQPVDYLTQIKPVLVERCAACHGGEKQESGLRLDAVALALEGGDRGPAVVPGNSGDSLLVKALLGEGDVQQMPAEADPLPAEQIALIRRWIDEGAKGPADESYPKAAVKSDHWAFQPIRRPAPPAVSKGQWLRNAIDAFVLARLEQEGIEPSPEADRTTLIRRLSLDLRGLPPKIEEIDEYLADDSPGAYERLVDRMLASPQYGERWGRHWLDIARYADSNGFTIDGARSIWKYRDWVIDAFNRDLPFDQFTLEQLAGDMLPNPTTDQFIATGFHRNTLINQEGGTDPEQFRVEAVVDRIETTSAAFLGLTIGCARCHAHKYDPISQRDFYELLAVFNNCDDRNSEDRASLVPILPVPTEEQAAEMRRLQAEIAAAEEPLKAHDAAFLAGLPQWVESITATAADATNLWTIIDPAEFKSEKGTLLTKKDDKSLYADFSAPPNDTFTVMCETKLDQITGIRLEALTHPDLEKNGPGRADDGLFYLTEVELLAVPAGSSEEPKPVRIARAVADHSQDGWPIGDAIDGKPSTGWGIGMSAGNPNVNREAAFLPAEPIAHAGGTRLVIKLHHDAPPAKYLLGMFRLSVSSASPDVLAVPAPIRAIAALPADQRTPEQQSLLEAAYKSTDSQRGPLAAKVGALKKQRDALESAIPTTLIMKEREQPREAYIHVRGDFLRKGAAVKGDVPAVLPPAADDNDNVSRLEFARWLADPNHPLTARVSVNRFWQQFFGKGLVETENDFGAQGIPPTHPELLDWLASEFMRLGWGTKAVHRLIVTSATYRQSSAVRADLIERDPANRLLARQSRLRLEAESIRDATLAASGLLTDTMHGPGVYPPQPEGIYVHTQIKKAWPESAGPDRYRRGVYTYFWRSSPYPLMPIFDAPDANTTCTRRNRSNTPLQSLTLANDRAFVELAAGLAARVLAEGPSYPEGRMAYAFRLCLSREPSDRELARLSEFLESQRSHFAADEQAAQAAAPADLVVAASSRRESGNAAAPANVSVAEAAAWTALARVLLNLDEFITRE